MLIPTSPLTFVLLGLTGLGSVGAGLSDPEFKDEIDELLYITPPNYSGDPCVLACADTRWIARIANICPGRSMTFPYRYNLCVLCADDETWSRYGLSKEITDKLGNCTDTEGKEPYSTRNEKKRTEIQERIKTYIHPKKMATSAATSTGASATTTGTGEGPRETGAGSAEEEDGKSGAGRAGIAAAGVVGGLVMALAGVV
ncbi:hypothetical protein EX30DRAFT_121197 [Ascodesmis nigricans]|uniref:Uncharacterized protein n=1 Tax=Ascodesmis nigricans TaxID=341454 RepID=A0A4S2MSJ9_9PEZI|nr:hypothetical protein EX30DRAFT_121197 [Ascodesmis nigricans]